MVRHVIGVLAAATAFVASVAGTAFAQEKILVAFGDSTTARRDKDKVVVYATLLDKAFAAQNLSVKVVNAGIGGNNTTQGRTRFDRDVVAHKPSVVVIQFGLNDAAVDVWRNPPETSPRISEKQYEENLRGFVQTLKGKGSEVILMTPNPARWSEVLRKLYGKPPHRLDDPDGYNVFVSRYAEVVRTLAREEKVTLIDIYDIFQKYGKESGQSVDDLLLPDGMHPNSKGHELIARLLLASKPVADRFAYNQPAAEAKP